MYYRLGSGSRHVLDCHNLYIFLTQDTHGSMSSLETNAEWVAKMTMLNSQDFSHNVHIYTALQKGLGSLAMLDHFTVHQRDLKWTFNYYCWFVMAVFLNMDIWLELILMNRALKLVGLNLLLHTGIYTVLLYWNVLCSMTFCWSTNYRHFLSILVLRSLLFLPSPLYGFLDLLMEIEQS